MYEHAGIALTSQKKLMVAGRLAKRLNHFGLTSYADYFRLATSAAHADELQMLVNVLTTNETYFFREPQHFQFFRDNILKSWHGNSFRVWSAASSTGEEAYSLAMVLAENLGMKDWEVFASDLSTRVLERARVGIYGMDRLEHMDKKLLKKYCLKGVRSQSGSFRIDARLRDRVTFAQVNLMNPLPVGLGKFDVIFLRNVLIYFDQETKTRVVERLIPALNSGGYFIVSHSESLHNTTANLQMILPSIYRKA